MDGFDTSATSVVQNDTQAYIKKFWWSKCTQLLKFQCLLTFFTRAKRI